MRWADGFHRGRLGHDQPPRLSDRCVGQARRTSSRTARACCRCRRAAFPPPSPKSASGSATSRCCSPAWSARTAAGTKRPTFRAPPGSTISREALVWAGEREAIVPGVSYIGDGRADVMRGEEVQLLGAVAAGPGRPRRARLPSRARTTNGRCCGTGKIHDFRTVMTGELFSLLKEHSILADLLQGEVERERAFKRGARARASFDEALPADLFAVRAGVLLGQAKKEDAASCTSGLLIGADVRIGLTMPDGARDHRHGTAGAHPALCRRDRAGRPRRDRARR